jgi:hypothetical protein
MLFDLLDYYNAGLIGPMSATMSSLENPNLIQDSHTTYKATRDAFFKALKEYFFAAIVVVPLHRRSALNTIYSDLENKKALLNIHARVFWNSLLSNPSDINSQLDFDTYYGVDFGIYTTFTTSIFNQYINSLDEFMKSVKNLMIVADGDTFEEYIV